MDIWIIPDPPLWQGWPSFCSGLIKKYFLGSKYYKCSAKGCSITRLSSLFNRFTIRMFFFFSLEFLAWNKLEVLYRNVSNYGEHHTIMTLNCYSYFRECVGCGGIYCWLWGTMNLGWLMEHKAVFPPIKSNTLKRLTHLYSQDIADYSLLCISFPTCELSVLCTVVLQSQYGLVVALFGSVQNNRDILSLW